MTNESLQSGVWYTGFKFSFDAKLLAKCVQMEELNENIRNHNFIYFYEFVRSIDGHKTIKEGVGSWSLYGEYLRPATYEELKQWLPSDHPDLVYNPKIVEIAIKQINSLLNES